MELFYSIQELVELQSNMQNANYPNNRQGFEYRAKRDNWKFVEEKSIGRNGFTRKYMIPTDLAINIQNYLKPNNLNKNDLVSISALPNSIQTVNSLQHWQVEIAENRLYVVRYIQEQIRTGRKKTNVIEQMILDADTGNLLPEILEAIVKANAKAGDKRTVSRRSVFDWIKAVEDAELHKINVLSLLAPKARAAAEIPKWAVELLKLWGQPQKPTLTACLELLPQYLGNDIPCPSYAQAYRFLNEKMGNVDVQKGRMGNQSKQPSQTLNLMFDGQNNNVISASYDEDVSNVFSDLKILSQDEKGQHILAETNRTTPYAYSRLKIITLADVETQAEAQAAIDKVQHDNDLEAYTLTTTVPDWVMNGSVWKTTGQIHFNSDVLARSNAKWVVMGRTFRLNRHDGKTTELKLKREGDWAQPLIYKDKEEKKAKEKRERKKKKTSRAKKTNAELGLDEDGYGVYHGASQ